jgi:uncharacterized protein YdgA (DUF945 family)
MKKFLLILLLIGIAGFAGMSIWGSLRAKQAYRTVILAIAESPDTRVLETTYEGGWLQSEADASVEIRGPLGQSFQRLLVGMGQEEVRGRVGFRVRQTIEHGYRPLMDWVTGGLEGTPVIGRVETLLELDQETQSELGAVMDRLPPVSISTLIRASGIGESSVTVPAQRLESKLAADEGGGWTAEWAGLRGSIVYTTDLGHFAAIFHSGGIEGGSAESIFALRDLKWTADVTRDASGLLVGDVTSSVGSFRLSSREEGGPGLEFDKWGLTQSSAVKAGSYGSALELRVEAIRIGDQAFGPGNLELQLQDLDARSLARLQSEGVAGSAPSEAQDVRPAAADGGAPSLLSDLVARSPRLEIHDLRLATPTGDVEANLSIDLDGSRPALLHDLFTLLLVVQVHAEFECPAEILDALYQEREEELQQLRREGWVLLDGERYRSRLEFERGELVVNGLPKTLGDLPRQPEAPPELTQISGAEGIAPGSELLP